MTIIRLMIVTVIVRICSKTKKKVLGASGEVPIFSAHIAT